MKNRQWMSPWSRCLGSIVAAVLMCGLGCETTENATTTGGATGMARIAITNAPDDVSCIVITAEGTYRTREKSFDVSPGDSTVFLNMNALPLGLVLFTADAYGEACVDVDGTTVPNWVSDPVEASIAAGQVADVLIPMMRNGLANVGVDFPDEPTCFPDGDACVENAQCCSGSCMFGVCAPAMGCTTLTVSGFSTQAALNTTFTRYDALAWESTDHTITYSAEDELWEIWKKPEASGASRPAICEAAVSGEGPWDCTEWREWRGSSLGFVAVPASFVCDD
jgi:hypothetical protein